MPGLPWTKYQDFYLRLGFLKVLVAVLSPQRRSVANESLERRLKTPLFSSAKQGYPALYGEARERLPSGVDFPTSKKPSEPPPPSVTEALLMAGDSPSWLFAITEETTYKVLDWARNVHFVGPGNQITERGLLLRQLLPEKAAGAFLSGDPAAWNPFILTDIERLFFLYHLCEIDELTAEIVLRLGGLDLHASLESPDASNITCRALFAVLDRSRQRLAPRDLPAFRTARELACAIARELDLSDLVKRCGGMTPRVPKARVLSVRTATSSHRKTTKNADHQTIPRFEQLVDLGFLIKPGSVTDELSYKTLAQRRWKYQPTPRCHSWGEALGHHSTAEARWLWGRFARAAVQSGIAGVSPKPESPGPTRTAHFLAEAYARVHRPMGHTPFESVALLAMMLAATEGYVLEMTSLHRLLLEAKRLSLLSDVVFFASGNDLDKMFVLFKPGFERGLLDVYDRIQMPSDRQEEPK
jgi:hypothetical protein